MVQYGPMEYYTCVRNFHMNRIEKRWQVGFIMLKSHFYVQENTEDKAPENEWWIYLPQVVVHNGWVEYSKPANALKLLWLFIAGRNNR